MLVGSYFNASSSTCPVEQASAPRSIGVLSVDGTHRHHSYIASRIQIAVKQHATVFSDIDTLAQREFRLDVATA